MTSIWAESVAAAVDEALITLALAVGVCDDDVWQTSMWEVPARDPARPLTGPGGGLVTDAAERLALVQRFSTPWSVAWHALEVLDYDLSGEFAPWSPPPPFTGKAHWRDRTMLPTAWSRSDLLGCVHDCRQRVRETLKGMTDEKAATLLPPAHRYRGQPYAWILTGIPGHTIEHASQIRQFTAAASYGGHHG